MRSLCVYLTPRLVKVGNEHTVPGPSGSTNAYQHGPPYQNPSVLTCDFPYQTLPDPVLAERNPMVILAWSTNAYHSRNLALVLPCETFTNHYRRGEGLGIMYCHNGLGTVIDCGQHPTGLVVE